ncbi:MAG TPA: MBL fold metallo-hydrolase [Gammaproteobacteria bacterium]|nr:MBL fold metallo-hydrolase [Gammaproteobacteria bacterium]
MASAFEVSRREVLRGIAALSLAPLAASVARAADTLTVADVAAGIKVISGGGGNVVVLPTGAGLVVVDSGAAAAKEETLAKLAKEEDKGAGGKVIALVNTHWHPDQTGANEALGMGGATIIAHAKTRQRLTAGWYVPHEDRYEKPLPVAGRPTKAFYTTQTETFGNRRVELGYLINAHTDGDIYVRVPDANVIVAGDVISPQRDPVLDWFGGGWLGGRVDALAKLLVLGDARTRYVPAFGPVIGRAEVQAEHDLMTTIFDRMVVNLRQGQTSTDMLKAGVLDGLPRKFADPAKFLYDAQKGFWANHNKLMPDIV